MNRKFSLIIALGLAVGGCSQIPIFGSTLSSENVGKIATEITVMIDGCTSGSGVIFKKEANTYSVLTAHHVVKDKIDNIGTCLIFTADGERYPVSNQVTVPIEGVDLAVVTFESNKTYKLAEWGDSEKATVEKVVYVAGAPAPSEAIPTRTFFRLKGEIVGRVPQPFEGYNLIYDNKTSHGMSGGPVLNEEGRVIGIHGKGDKQEGIDTGRKLGIPIQFFLKPETAKGNQSNPTDANGYLSQGIAFAEQGDYHGALANYDQAIKLDSNYAEAYFNRGYAYSYLGEKQKAIADYTQVIQLKPNYAEVFHNRGAAYYHLGEKQKAITDFNQAIQLMPNNAYAYTGRGNAYLDLGEKQKAIADYNQAIQLIPSNAHAYAGRGNTYYSLGEKQKAITDYNQAIQLNPNLAEPYTGRGIVYLDLGEKQKAIADYTQAIKLNPNLEFAYIWRGLAYYHLGEKQKGIADLNQAIKLNPNNPDAFHKRGVAYYYLGEKQKGIADYNQAIQLNPNLAEPYFGRGVAYSDLGEKQKAIQDFQKAAELYKQQGNQEWYQKSLNKIKELQ